MKKILIGCLVALGIKPSFFLVGIAIFIVLLLQDSPEDFSYKEKDNDEGEEGTIYEDEYGNEVDYATFKKLRDGEIEEATCFIRKADTEDELEEGYGEFVFDKEDMEKERQIMRLKAKEARTQMRLAQTRSAMRALKTNNN